MNKNKKEKKMEMAIDEKGWIDIPSSVFNEEYLKDPYPVYEKLRSLGRVVRMVDGENQTWVFSHYDDVADIQKDKRFISKRTPKLLKLIPREHHDKFKYLLDFIDMLLVSHDGAQHMRLRKAMNHGFTTLALSKLKSDIQASVDMLLDRVEDREEMEFVSEFSRPFPTIVIMKILGVALDELEAFMTWSDEVAALLGSIRKVDVSVVQKGQEAVKNMMDRFAAIIIQRKRKPEEDLISHMLSAKDDDGGQLMTDTELAAQCCLLMFNGNETTRNLLANTLMLLFTHEQEKRKLDNNPALLDSAIEESLRFESPAQLVSRVASEDFDYLGVPICQGDSVIFVLASSHRDSAQYAQPDSFNITRDEKQHMAFGHGPHYCIGAELSRLEAQIALSTLFKRFPNIALDNEKGGWQWNMNPIFRGVGILNVKF
jgi:cytochrome P450